jgi:hypothetical protein
MTRDELLEKRKILLQEKRELQQKLADPRAEAKVVYNLIFKEKFATGGKWLERTKVRGQQNKVVVGMLGGVRHLYGYLHPNEYIQGAINSIIQGSASNIGFIGGYLTRKMIWDWFESRGIFLEIKFCNYVHDASYVESPYVNISLGNYLLEHGLTTMCHAYIRDNLDFTVNISFETDCALGPTLAEMEDATRWDDQVAIIEKSIKWKRDNLGLKQPIEEIMKIVKHNAEIIFELRREEIKNQLANETRILYEPKMNYDNALKLGLIFKLPKAVKKQKILLDGINFMKIA